MPADWSISVSQLNEYVRKIISGDPMLRSIRVRGELSGFKRHVSGHLYFTLKDEQARVQCVMFRQNALSLRFAPRDGMRVTVTGSASLFAQSGAYQLYVDAMTQEGAGELFLRFEALKQQLSAEGLFDPALKKPIPMLPRVVGVVTSRTGAVLRDIVRVAGRRNPHVSILLAASAVQGAGAAEEIVAALDRLNRDGRADVILCGRGGGSMEDLWPFNEEIVARAIARSRIPVISCVGHETDFTIADFVADLRAPTPSAAAELAVPVAAELENALVGLSARMTRALMTRQQLMRARLERLTTTSTLSAPHRIVEARARQVDMLLMRMRRALSAQLAVQERRVGALAQLTARLENVMTRQMERRAAVQERRADMLAQATARLESAMARQMERRRAQTETLCRELTGLNPAAVLERGYAAVYVDGRAVNGVEELSPGVRIAVRMRDGAVGAVVDGPASVPAEARE